jgi:hypothetical protein
MFKTLDQVLAEKVIACGINCQWATLHGMRSNVTGGYEYNYSEFTITLEGSFDLRFEHLQKLSEVFGTTNINIGTEHAYYGDIDSQIVVKDATKTKEALGI